MIVNEIGTIMSLGAVTCRPTKKGEWKEQTIVLQITTSATTYKMLAIRANNDIINDIAKFQVGNLVKVGYFIASREWNGKWFTNCDLCSIETAVEGHPVPERKAERPSYVPDPKPEVKQPDMFANNDDPNDDLPI